MNGIDPNSERGSLDAAIASADPVDRGLLTAVRIERALDDIGGAILAQRRPATRTRRLRLPRTRTVAGLGIAVASLTAAVAGAATWNAHTGVYQPTSEQIAHADAKHAQIMKSQLSMGGPGEMLDPAAPNFRAVALQVASDIPYPPGYESWRDFIISDEITMADGSTESSGALHGWFAASAFCAWVQDWRQAEISGDTAGRSQAEQVISYAPSWPAVTEQDPSPDASITGDLGTAQYSQFGWMLPYRAAVLAGNRARVDQLLAAGYGGKCWTSDPQWRALLASHPQWRELSGDDLAQKYVAFLASARP